MRRLSLLSLVLAAAMAVPRPVDAQSLGVDFTSVNTNFTNGAWSLGFAFTALANTSVVGLGFYDDYMDGLRESHDIGLWTAGGSLLASTTIGAGTGSTLMSFFRTTAISSVALTAGEQYVVAATTGSENYTWYTNDFTTDSRIQFDNDLFVASTTLAFPTASDRDGDGYFGANIVLASVPEPATFMLLGTGLIGLLGVGVRRRRQDTL